MKHYEIKYFNGDTLIHFAYLSDSSICGSDLAGDETLGYSEAVETNKKVTCAFCAQIVTEAKKVKSSELDDALK